MTKYTEAQEVFKQYVVKFSKGTLLKKEFLKNYSELFYKNEFKPESSHLASEDVAVSLLKNYKKLKL